ncbi:hypothetical protein CJF30_00004494 [Rutstroemia sp. NJR-2017a BBW]|nr:hypothetical protein CJF30_00004494 [Rutstroemia sp. NJR-2017a BBW]
MRIIEAKFRRAGTAKMEVPQYGRHSVRPEPDAVLGDYFAEVMLDGFLSSASVHVGDQQVEIVCGAIEIPVDKLERGKDNEAWWPILDDKQEQVGEMLMKVRHDEVVVLLAKDYQPISELLHNFNNVSGTGAEWLKALVEDEIDGIGKEAPSKRQRWSRRIGSNEISFASMDREKSVRDMGKSLNTEANLLFRGNSLLTQALDFHMRRVGKEYLSEILGEQISTINNINPDCEVDPSKIESSEAFDKNWTSLINLTNDVWRSIADSATRCPPELRQIFKYIRAVAEDRYGDFLRTVAYTSVSGEFVELWAKRGVDGANEQIPSSASTRTLKKRTDECILKAEEYGDRMGADQVSLQFEDIVEGLQGAYLQQQQQQQIQNYMQRDGNAQQQLQPILTPTWLDYSMSNSTSGSIVQTPTQLLAPGSAGSGGSERERERIIRDKDKDKDKKETKTFWEATFGKDSKYQRPYQPPYESPSQPQERGAQDRGQLQASSPPGKGFGHSRNEKQSRSFLGGLRRKGKEKGEREREPKSQGSGSSADNVNMGVGAAVGMSVDTGLGMGEREDVTSPTVAGWNHGGMF